MYTFIIIDDEKLIRKGTLKKLQPMENEITCIGEAENGIEGIELVQKLSPDFVILDMQMPMMDGTKLLPFLAQNYPEMPLIVISGFRDFDYVKHAISADAIDYLLKPFSRDAIQDCVQRAIQRLENNQTIFRQIMDSKEEKETARYEYDIQYLTNLILGYHTGDAAISSEKLNFINDTHRLMLLTLYFEDSSKIFNVQEWLAEGGFGDLALYLSNTTSPQTGFLVLFIPNAEVISPQTLARQISGALCDYARHMERSLLIGISHVHSDLQQLHKAFEETATALNQQKLSDVSGNYYLCKKAPDPASFTWNKEEEFLFRLEAGMKEEVLQLTDNLFDCFSHITDFTLSDAKYYCYYLSTQCHRILNRYLKQDNEKSSNSMQNIISYIFRLEDLKNYYMQFFLNITEMLKTESIYAREDIVEKIQLYMKHNYQKNLTQDFVASLFYLNRSYLSTLFKHRTGMKFIDYLNEIRIEKAKEMLSGSTKKMYQISKAVGYDNPKYFFRIFKKKTNLTPEQYRTQNTKLAGSLK